MDLVANLALGLDAALSTSTLIACAAGVTLGTLIGVLPGIGPVAGISLLLPLSFHQQPTDALVMLAGLYYGAMYGGSIASILLNLPGESASAITCLDGYPMAKQGRGGIALFMTTVASFIGACFSIVLMAAFAPALAEVALTFGSVEYFSMMVLGLVAAATLATEAPLKGVAMVVVGLLLGLVGADVQTSYARFTFGRLELLDGISIVVVAMGLFGVSEVLLSFDEATREPVLRSKDVTWRSMAPTRDDFRRSWSPVARGSLLGAALGALPGAGATMSAFLAYALEKRLAKDPSRFGKGAIEGVAAAEAANNAAAQAAFIPTMTLGIPGNSVMALMIGALMIHGIVPGPTVVSERPDLFWGLIMSFWIGNVLLLVLNIPLIGLWVRILTIPYRVLFPAILFFICIGVYSVGNRTFDVFLVLVFGLVGYAMKVLDFPIAPLLLGFILGPLMEEHLRRALLLSHGDLSVFATQPISAAFLAVSALFVLYSVWSVRRGR